MKKIILLLAAYTSAAFAGGGRPRLDYYDCSSPTKQVSVRLVTELGSDLYKPGLHLLVKAEGAHSFYKIVTYSNDGNLIQFAMKPGQGQPDLGEFIFSDELNPTPKTIIQVKTKNSVVTASDVTCKLL